jgi:hypothetical protein
VPVASVLPLGTMSESAGESTAKRRRAPSHHVPSPLDPFLREFLAWIAALDGGLNPTQGIRSAAEEFDWQPAFVEVLFTAARSRGLVQPVVGKGTRGRAAWQLSARGAAMIENRGQAAPPVTAAGSDAT